MITVKELENQLKISKVSIYNMLKKDEFKSHVFKDKNKITLIDDIGEELLKAYYLKERGETIKDIITETITHEEETTRYSKDYSKENSKDDDKVKNPDIIGILQQQLETKDEQINNLLKIVLNHQQLHGAQLLTDSQNVINNEDKPEKPQRKGFFRNLFKK